MSLHRKKMQLVCRDATDGPANRRVSFAHHVVAVRHSCRASWPDRQVIDSVPQNPCGTPIVFDIVKNWLPDCSVAFFHPSMKPLDRSRPGRMGIAPRETKILSQGLYREIPSGPFGRLFHHATLRAGQTRWHARSCDHPCTSRPAQEAKDAAAFLDASAMPIALVPIGPTQLLGTCQHDLSIFRFSLLGWAPVLRKLSRILLAMFVTRPTRHPLSTAGRLLFPVGFPRFSSPRRGPPCDGPRKHSETMPIPTPAHALPLLSPIPLHVVGIAWSRNTPLRSPPY